MKPLFRILSYFLVLLLGGLAAYGLFSLKNFSLLAPDRTDTTHSLVLEKVSGLGKMELVRYQFQDVVSHKVIRQWLPDPKVMLFAYGEAVGCIDFAKVDSNSITLQGDSLMFIALPQPEICYVKLDHNRSRVFDTRYTFFEEADLVDAAYRKAEEEILRAASRANILDKTKVQAEQFLIPMLEAISGKKVELLFPMTLEKNEQRK